VVNAHQMTSVAGLYAAGDVVRALNQIAVATGEAAVAVTDIHNRLRRGVTGHRGGACVGG
jgi:thioredoxin reductase (NADPH)